MKNPKRLFFSADMVRTWRANRKTQTRRIVSVQPPHGRYTISRMLSTTGDQKNVGKYCWVIRERNGIKHFHDVYFPCPYGEIGDTLAIAEPLIKSADGYVHYAADNQPVRINDERQTWNWKPSKLAARYCPNRMIRSHTRINGLAAERLTRITLDDCLAEGTDGHEEFKTLWNSINAKTGGTP